MINSGNLPDYVKPEVLENRLGDVGIGIMEKKYLQKDSDGFESPANRLHTIASAVAGVEEKYDAKPKEIEGFAQDFYTMMAELDFLPGGRVLANAGTDIKALPNCYVLPVDDDLADIYQVVKEAAIVHKNGGGTGYNFSQLRPRGWTVKNGIASGPISFAGQFDKETEVINSGNRRGANMGILNVDHVDILEFIRSKDVSGVLTNFNVSVGITDEFMEAYRAGGEYSLKFRGREVTREDIDEINENCSRMKAGSDVGKQSIPPSLEIRGDEVYNVYPEIEVLRPDVRLVKYEPDGEGKGGEKVVTKEELIGRVDENGIVKINAEIPFRLIAEYAHSRGDPGLIFLDAIERDNMLPSAGRLDTTNPCGEQPLHPYDACNLGSVNLKQFVTDSKDVDYDRLEGVVRSAVRFMDNVNDLNRGPIPKIEETVRNHRRIGLGVMGWADMLMKMRIGYDSEKGYDLAEKVMGFVDEIAKSESINLARTKGVFPMFDDSNYDDSTRVRNLARTTIAPTGSISMVADANSGIEPWYGLIYYKQMRGGDKVRIVNSEFSLALEERGIVGEDVEKILSAVEGNGGSCQGIDGVPEEIQKVFKTSGDISYNAHIEMQSRFQKHVDNAISKTINVPKSGSVEDILNAYDLAHKQGCKGITVYRDGSLETQVLNIGDGGSVKSSRRELLEGMVSKELARPRPEDVEGPTMKIPTPHGHNAFVTFNWATNGDGKDHPYECFVNIGKAGGDLPALSEMGGRLISTLLKVGVNPNYIVKQLEGIEGQQSTGFGKERVTSLPDAFAQAIKKALDKKGYDGGVVDGVVVEGEGVDGVVEGGVVETVLIKDEPQVTSNLCPECMGMLVKEEGCIKCHQCGFSRC